MAEKYGVSYPTLRGRADKEGWVEQREKQKRINISKASQKIAEANATNATIAANLKKRLLLRLQRIENNYPADATEVRQKEGEQFLVYRIKDLTASYKDLTDDIPKGETQNDKDNGNSLVAAIMTAAQAQAPIEDVPENVGEAE